MSDPRESCADCGELHQGEADVLIRKQRKGPVGSHRVVWLKEYTKFENLGYGEHREEEEESGVKSDPTQVPEDTGQQGFGFKTAEESDLRLEVTQVPEKAEQVGFGFRTADGEHKDFPT